MQEKRHRAIKEKYDFFNAMPLEILLAIYSFLPGNALVSLSQVNHLWRKSAILSLFEKYHPHDFIYQKALAMHWNDHTAFELSDSDFFKKLIQNIRRLIENKHINMYQKIFLLQLFHRLHNHDLYDNAFKIWLNELIQNVNTVHVSNIYITSSKILSALFPFIMPKQREELIKILFKKLEKRYLSTWLLIFLTDIRYVLNPQHKEQLIEKYIQHIQNSPWLDAHIDLLIQFLPEIIFNKNQIIMKKIIMFLNVDETGKNFKGITHYWKNFSLNQREELIKIMLRRINDKNLKVQKNFHGILCSLHPQFSPKEIAQVIKKSLKYLEQGINEKHYYMGHIFSSFSMDYKHKNMKIIYKKMDKIIEKMNDKPQTCLVAAALLPVVKKSSQIKIHHFIETSLHTKNWFPEEDSLQLLNPYIHNYPPVFALNNMLENEPFNKTFLVSICQTLNIMKDHIDDAMNLHFINYLIKLFAKYDTATRIVIAETLIQWLPGLPCKHQAEISAQLLPYIQDPFPWEMRILVCEIVYPCIKIFSQDQKQIILNTLKNAFKYTGNLYCSKAALILEQMIPQMPKQQIPLELENILTIFLNPVASLMFQEQALELYIKLICQPEIKCLVKSLPQINCTLNLQEDSGEIHCLKMFMRFYKPYNESTSTPAISKEVQSASLTIN